MVIRYISKGKGKSRKVIPIHNKNGVSIRSVSLKPTAIQKVNKEQGRLLNKGETANFSKALNSVIMRAKRIGRINTKELVRWKSSEGGAVKYFLGTDDGFFMASLVDGYFPNEMNIRLSSPDMDRIEIRGHRSIMDKWTFNQFKENVIKNLERWALLQNIKVSAK